MLIINSDYNLNFYFEFFINYLNQFDITTLSKNELFFWNDLLIKNILLINFNTELIKIGIFFNNIFSSYELFSLLLNFTDIKNEFQLNIDSDIEYYIFMYIYLMDLFIDLNIIYSSFFFFLINVLNYTSINVEYLESLIIFMDFIYFTSFNYIVINDIFNLKLYISFLETHNLLNINLWFYNIIFLFFLLIFTNLFTLSQIYINYDLFFSKFFLLMTNISKLNRFNLDIAFITFLIIIESFIFTIIQVEDNKISFVEFIDLYLIYFLCLISLMLFYKYSTHYFSFLEQSVIEGKNSSFVLKQFIRDTSNTFALLLRFFLLLFRLNIYDGLDDFLDSYCLFFSDFNENSEISSISTFMLQLSNSDYFFLYDDINDDMVDYDFHLYFDLFNLFFILLTDTSNYWLFILEEIFRLTLAFYIIYLIIFEAHAVNFSYLEDSYIIVKKDE